MRAAQVFAARARGRDIKFERRAHVYIRIRETTRGMHIVSVRFSLFPPRAWLFAALLLFAAGRGGEKRYRRSCFVHRWKHRCCGCCFICRVWGYYNWERKTLRSKCGFLISERVVGVNTNWDRWERFVRDLAAILSFSPFMLAATVHERGVFFRISVFSAIFKLVGV